MPTMPAHWGGPLDRRDCEMAATAQVLPKPRRFQAMPVPPLPDELQALLREPHPAVIATLKPDGSPLTVATWYLWEAGRVLVNLDDGRARLEHLRRDPRVSLTVLDSNWYRHVSLQGRVTEMYADEGLRDIDRIARHYRGEPYPARDRPRTSAWVEVSRWHAWGA
jgi:PPOX class probable F420-dependent enzyme